MLDLINPKTKDLLFLPSELKNDLKTMDEVFKKFKEEHIENKFIYIENIQNVQELIQKIIVKSSLNNFNDEISSFHRVRTFVIPQQHIPHSKLQFNNESNIMIRKMRGINKEYFKWIKDNILFNLERVYLCNNKEYWSYKRTPKGKKWTIHQLSSPNFK